MAPGSRYFRHASKARISEVFRRFGLPILACLAFASPMLADSGTPAEPAGGDQIIWWGIAGNWNSSAHWSPTLVPDAPHEFAWIQGGGGTYTIDLDVSPSLFKMQLNDTTVTLRLNGNSITVNSGSLVNEGIIVANTGVTSALTGPIANTATGDIGIVGGATLGVGGPTLVNDGVVTVNTTSTFPALLNIDGSTTVGGAGVIYLPRPNGESQLATAPGMTLTQQAGHLIRGRGQVHASLVNYGEVRADFNAYTLFLMTSGKANHGLMRAIAGSELEINGITLDNAGGVLRADGGTVTLNGVTIQGGTLERTGTSVVIGAGAVTLDGVMNTGQYRINNATTTTVTGPVFENPGLVDLNVSSGSPTFLVFADTTTLQGGGAVYMLRPNGESQLTTGASGRLIQAAGHLIHGRGQVHASLVNHGEVRSDFNGYTLLLDSKDKWNDGLMRAIAGSELEVNGITLDNTGGILRADGGTVTLANATLRGGTLERTGTSVVIGAAAVTLDGVTHTGQYRINNATTTTVTGPVFENSGLIDLNASSGSPTSLVFPDTTTLQGSGTVYMLRPNGESQLTTGTSGRLTQAAGHLIRGRGQVHASLVNHGEVRSDFNGYTLLLDSKDKWNDGLMRATAGGELEINGITIDNTGGFVRADGGTVTLANAALRGGTLERTGTSIEVANGSVALEGVTHTGELRVSNTSTLTVRGPAFQNSGLVMVNSGSGAATNLAFQDSVTVGGAGTIFLARPNAESQIRTVTPGTLVTQAAGHVIRGRGQIHARVRNEGTIRADFNGYALTMDSTVTSTGAIEAIGGATMSLTRTPTNWTADSTLTGGAWRCTSSTLRVTGVIVARNAAEILLEGVSSQFYRDAGTTNALTPFKLNDVSGRFTIRNGRDFATAGAFTNRGALGIESATSAFTVLAGQPFVQESGSTMLVAGGTLVATGGVTVQSGALGGTGTVQSTVSLTGTSPGTGPHLVPGGAGAAGQLNITGTCALSANTTTEVDLGGVAAGQSDLVSISGAATLGGTLALNTLLATYAPDEGDTIKVMRFPSRTGTFASVTGLLPYPGIMLTPVYTDTTVLIAVSGVLTSVPGIELPGEPAAENPDGAAGSSEGESLPDAIAFRASSGGAVASFELALPDPAHVRITLYDARGRRVGTLLDAALPAGRRTIGTESGGVASRLASGVYLARAEIGSARAGAVRVARIVIVR